MSKIKFFKVYDKKTVPVKNSQSSTEVKIEHKPNNRIGAFFLNHKVIKWELVEQDGLPTRVMIEYENSKGSGDAEL